MGEVESSRRVHDGGRIGLRSDEVRTPDGRTESRDVVEHPGGAAVVAVDDRRRVLLVGQDRHAVGEWLWELPQGFRDGEEPLEETARRELREEAGLQARAWQRLVVLHASPGVSDEVLEVHLATGLSSAGEPAREPGEAGMQLRWVDLDDAVADVLGGRLTGASTVAGLLATAVLPDSAARGGEPDP